MKEGFEPCLTMDSKLFVNREGQVYSTFSGIILKPHLNQKGYQRLTVTINGIKKSPTIHQLVALAFIPNPDNKPQVNHKDGNKLNNHVDNLEWVTNEENRLHALENGLINYSITTEAMIRKTSLPVIDTQTGIFYDSVSEAIRFNPNRLYLAKMHKKKCDFKFVS